MKTFLFCLALFVLAGTAMAADYGVKTRYKKGTVLNFPDCEMVFTGTHNVSGPKYPRGFLYYDFTVTVGGKSKTASWSSGTGDIGPLFFEVGGRKFVLELAETILAKGFMKNDELVLWREGDYLRKKK